MHDSVDGKSRDAAESELIHDVFAVSDNSREGDIEAVGNLLVDKPLDDECHYLDFAVGKNFLLKHLRGRGQILAVTVGMLLEGKQLTDELGLGLIDAKGVELAGLRAVGELEGKHNGLTTALDEVGAVGEDDI